MSSETRVTPGKEILENRISESIDPRVTVVGDTAWIVETLRRR